MNLIDQLIASPAVWLVWFFLTMIGLNLYFKGRHGRNARRHRDTLAEQQRQEQWEALQEARKWKQREDMAERKRL